MMLNKEEINEIAKRYIEHLEGKMNIKLAIAQELTINNPYGNIYSYGLKDSTKHRLAGNGSFLLKNDTGIVIQFGTSNDVEYYIKGYEDGTWKNQVLMEFGILIRINSKLTFILK